MGGRKITATSLKKKGPAHPNSRRAHQMARIALRQNKINASKDVRDKARNARVDRIMTFILLLPEEKSHLPDLYSLHDFVRTFYLPRYDDDLAELEKEQRPGRPPSRQLTELRDRISAEAREYNEGMEVPDLCNATNVELLRAWQGDPQALHLFRFPK
ncbi:translation machinery-associated protein 16 [Malassezia cuniculi]|uniref:Translation machinery-associated protein 16 n=1 Tax=Malassezia cuniculi TaxID=948313 RepID=A0AAF0EX89_9BASI|nr:translation machinery-associated protein 16 [Malassezia cuniculi]